MFLLLLVEPLREREVKRGHEGQAAVPFLNNQILEAVVESFVDGRRHSLRGIVLCHSLLVRLNKRRIHGSV